MLKLIVATAVMVSAASSFALEKKVREEINNEIKQACSAEIAKAACSEKSFGKGLMKCLQSYKKEHKDFVISEGCKDARHKVKELRKEAKADKASVSPIAPPVK